MCGSLGAPRCLLRAISFLGLLSPVPTLADPPWLTVDLGAVSPSTGLLRRVLGSTGTGDSGVPVASGRDVDGDATPDYAFSSMRASPLGRTGAGEIYVVFGDGALEGSLDTADPEERILRIAGAGSRRPRATRSGSTT